MTKQQTTLTTKKTTNSHWIPLVLLQTNLGEKGNKLQEKNA